MGSRLILDGRDKKQQVNSQLILDGRDKKEQVNSQLNKVVAERE